MPQPAVPKPPQPAPDWFEANKPDWFDLNRPPTQGRTFEQDLREVQGHDRQGSDPFAKYADDPFEQYPDVKASDPFAPYADHSLTPPPDQPSLRGFLQNVYSSGTRFVGNMADTIASAPNTFRAVSHALANPSEIPGDVADIARGVGTYVGSRYGTPSEWWNDPGTAETKALRTIYTDPVGAAGDASAVAGGLSGAARGVGLSTAGRVLGATGEVLNPLSVPLRVVGTGAAAAGNAGTRQAMRIGARGRNAELLADTVNPGGVNTAGAGAEVQRAIVNRRDATLRPLQQGYTDLLGTDARPTPLGAAQRFQDVEGPASGLVDASGRPVPGAAVRVPVGDTFRQLHDRLGDLTQQYRRAATAKDRFDLGTEIELKKLQMQDLARAAGLSDEAAQYFSHADTYKQSARIFDNKFVASLLNNKPDTLVDLFLSPRGGLRSFKPSPNAPFQPSMSTGALIDHLEQIVPPAAMDRLRSAVGERLLANVSNAQGEVSGPMLWGRLRNLEQQGALSMVPNAERLKQVAQILTQQRGGNAMTLPVASLSGRVVNKLLRTVHLDTPDLATELRQLQQTGHPVADQIVSAIGGAITPATVLQRSQRAPVSRPAASLTPPPSAEDWFSQQAPRPSFVDDLQSVAGGLAALHR